uniref:Bulb-type lectin domain-containing protein n=1 Tax=Solanum lycopersicum TaxID=4081 RepID=A0A3Q7H4W1_SOLLC
MLDLNKTVPEEGKLDLDLRRVNYDVDVKSHLRYGDWVTFKSHSSKKVRISRPESSRGENSDRQPQDADYPSLSYELESEILARFPRWEYWKLSLVNKRCSTLLKSGEIFEIRKENGFREPSVYMLASGETNWWTFDREFKSRRKIPDLPSDVCFKFGDKESLCAGTHLLVSGREIDGLVIWRFELATNCWYKGPSMVNPRCLFASATCGTSAFVAGGVGIMANSEVYDTAEKYNPNSRSWETLPRMKRKRKLCSGCYMDNKFYVIGGRNENGELTCGEFFDEGSNKWELIPDMLRDDPVLTCHSPPLIAVVNNELYSLEASSNKLKLYLKKTNTWKMLGQVPVRADSNRGWGIAFKSLGNELLVIGAASSSASYSGDTISANKSLSFGETTVSSGEKFELGFFKPGNSFNYYIGIWYKNTILWQNVVWVANRDKPLDYGTTNLTILHGNLVLIDKFQGIVWKTHAASIITSNHLVIAVLRDDGNLILSDMPNSSTPLILWESFDYPTDTLLPGAKLGYDKRRTQRGQVLISWKSLSDPAPGLYSLELDPSHARFVIKWNRTKQFCASGS